MKSWILAAILLLLSACAKANVRSALVLLAPFEGRYREIGYEALYAARLALADTQASFNLIPIDDGGTPELAVQRARAVAQLENTAAVILLGENATKPDVQEALSPALTWIVGWWGSSAAYPHVHALHHARIGTLAEEADTRSLTELAETEALTSLGDIGGLLGFARLRLSSGMPFDNLTILSSGWLPDSEFSQRYLSSAPFAPQPRLIAPQVYDAVILISRAAAENAGFESRFRDTSLPLYAYRLDEQGELTLDHIVE